LGFLDGRVKAFYSEDLKIPQTGWNQIQMSKNSELLHNVEGSAYVYFNHSYYCEPANPEDVLAQTEYGQTYASAVQKSNLYGVQFHPEKSQRIGIQILKNFVERC
jgi:imidazole glycerol-phosphate synthase subunit HisH